MPVDKTRADSSRQTKGTHQACAMASRPSSCFDEPGSGISSSFTLHKQHVVYGTRICGRIATRIAERNHAGRRDNFLCRRSSGPTSGEPAAQSSSRVDRADVKH